MVISGEWLLSFLSKCDGVEFSPDEDGTEFSTDEEITTEVEFPLVEEVPSTVIWSVRQQWWRNF